ncbi:hypothetical protein Taro_034216 [Colocasia esculenta]|uniref:Uncharacterized protein n=1 Tax=Colocasia esculenta TaxID=4460 RepID=A0A843W3G4_COLES|nr:hypothetical protein [Colocasia esculenta]
MGGQVKGKTQLLPPAAARLGEEEEQMEEFFGLLKSVREMNDRRRAVGGCSPLKKARVARSTAWTPAFEWEDFAGDAAASRKRPAAGPISSEDGGETKEEKVEGNRSTLDLNLPVRIKYIHKRKDKGNLGEIVDWLRLRGTGTGGGHGDGSGGGEAGGLRLLGLWLRCGDDATRTVECYDPASDQWATAVGMR